MDKELKKTIYRRDTELPVLSLEEMDDRISDYLAMMRERANITREEMAQLMGLSQQFYGRTERRQSQLRVARLILIIEILGPEMFDAIGYAAPQIFGRDEAEAKARSELISAIMKLPAKNMYEISTYVRLLSQIVQNEQYQSDREEVGALRELMVKNGMSVEEVTKLVHVEKAKRGPMKRRRRRKSDTGEPAVVPPGNDLDGAQG